MGFLGGVHGLVKRGHRSSEIEAGPVGFRPYMRSWKGCGRFLAAGGQKGSTDIWIWLPPDISYVNQ
jgi:hypothetical protein